VAAKCTTWCSTRKLHFTHRGDFDIWSSHNVGRVVPTIRPVCLFSLFVREYILLLHILVFRELILLMVILHSAPPKPQSGFMFHDFSRAFRDISDLYSTEHLLGTPWFVTSFVRFRLDCSYYILFRYGDGFSEMLM
jgi:hypothetical protein